MQLQNQVWYGSAEFLQYQPKTGFNLFKMDFIIISNYK